MIYFIFWLGFMLPNTVKVTLRLSSFIGGGRPQVPLRVLFQAQEGT